MTKLSGGRQTILRITYISMEVIQTGFSDGG